MPDIIIDGDSSTTLATNLAGIIGADLVTTDTRIFPDGESKIILSGVPSGRCIIVQSIYPPVDTNLVRALTLVSVAAETSNEVIIIVPYMGYARQDQMFLPGEVVTLRHIARLFSGAGADRLITVDIHSNRGLVYFGNIGSNVSAVPYMARYFVDIPLERPLVVSPDLGGRERAETFARIMGTDCITLEKNRDRRSGEVSIRTKGVDMSYRDIILVDDMISTGGSIVKASEFLKGCGCGRVFVACTHALMVGDAAARIYNAGVESVVGANTVPGKESMVDISGIIAQELTKTKKSAPDKMCHGE